MKNTKQKKVTSKKIALNTITKINPSIKTPITYY